MEQTWFRSLDQGSLHLGHTLPFLSPFAPTVGTGVGVGSRFSGLKVLGVRFSGRFTVVASLSAGGTPVAVDVEENTHIYT